MLPENLYRTARVFWTVSLLVCTSWATAAPGDLDLTLARTGKTRLGFGGGSDTGTATAAQPDGKIVVAGYSLHAKKYQFCVVRYHPDGSLDDSFDGDGIATVAVGSSDAIATGVGVQADGKIVVGGYTSYHGAENYNDFVVVRLNPDGAPDASFGTNGTVITDVGGSRDEANALTLQGDGKIVLVGRSYVAGSGNFSAVRYTTTGLPDTSFDGDGKVMVHVGTGGGAANAVLLLAEGKLLLAGTADNPYADFALVRLLDNGALDFSFNGTGKVTTLGTGVATALAIQPGNNTVLSPDRIVVAGYSFNNSNDDIAVVRYNLNGSLDTTWGGTGKVTTPIGTGNDRAFAVRVTGAGTTPRRIVVAGSSYNGANSDFALVRYSANGSLDTTLGGDGKVTTPVGTGDDVARAMTISAGRFVLAGWSVTNLLNTVAVARYNSDGSLDATFDGDGKRTDNTDLGGRAGAYAVTIQPDGAMVIAGHVQKNAAIWLSDSNLDFAVARLLPDGTLDHSFGNRGRVTTDFYGGDNTAVAMALQPDGKIIAAGSGIIGSGSVGRRAFVFTRFQPDGTVDIIRSAEIGSVGSTAQAVALQPDGKIVMVGFTYINNTDTDFAVVRFDSNGALDGSFDGDGIVTTSMGTTADKAGAVALQPDGRIVVGGTAGGTVAVARYYPDGSLDSSFSFDGKVTTPVPGGSATATAIAIREGKILIGGGFNGGFALVRYQADGSLDTSFDGDGIATNGLRISSMGRAMALQTDGKILVAGYANADLEFPTKDFAVMRFNSNGSLDTSYGADGKMTVDFNGGEDSGYGLALDRDGRALVVGDAGNFFGIARLLGDVVPRLTILRIGPDLELSWPATALGSTLQSTPGLSAPIIWSDVPNSHTTTRVLVPNPTGRAFYRLKLCPAPCTDEQGSGPVE